MQRIVSGERLDGVLVNDVYICNTDVITLQPKQDIDLNKTLFYLGVLLSRPVAAYLKSQHINLDRATFPKIHTQTMLSLPVPSVTNLAETSTLNHMVKLVERMLQLHKLLAARSPQESETLERQIKSTDRQIDELVYELYGLTEEERKVVEG